MSGSEVGAIIATISAIIGGCVAIYKKGVKPFLAWVSKFEKADVSRSRFSILEKKMEYVSSVLFTSIQHSDAPYFICNESGLCIMANEKACVIFGAEQSEMKGFGWIEFISTREDQEYVRDKWETAIDNGENLRFSCVIKNGHTGVLLNIRFNAAFARNEESKIIVSIVKLSNE